MHRVYSTWIARRDTNSTWLHLILKAICSTKDVSFESIMSNLEINASDRYKLLSTSESSFCFQGKKKKTKRYRQNDAYG